MIKWLVGIVLAALTAGSLVFLVLAFSDHERRLVVPALGLALLVVAVLAVNAVRRTSKGSLALLVAAAAMMAAVGSVSGYRAWVWSTCSERIGPNGDLHGCDLTDENLVAADLASADLSDTNLAGADLSKAVLARADLRGADLADANLSGIDGARANFTGARLDGARMAGADLEAADLSRINGTRADFSKANLRDAILVGANLTRARLSDARLTSSNLTRANLSGANGSNAYFDYTKLVSARLTGVNLGNVDVTNADFTSATLRNVRLDGAKVDGAIGLTDARLSSALNVKPLDLARVLSRKGLFLEPQPVITTRLGAACRGRPVEGAGSSRSNGTVLLILRDQGRAMTDVRWNLQPTAVRFAEFVACLGPRETSRVDTCGPYVFTGTSTRAPNITRLQARQHVRLVNAKTARVVAQRTVEGSPPESCPFFSSSDVTSIGGRMPYGLMLGQIASMVPRRPGR